MNGRDLAMTQPVAHGAGSACLRPCLQVLVVEHDRGVVARLSHFLECSGYAVTEAENGLEAEAAMALRDFDLVLLDLLHPDGMGLDLCERILATSETRIIVVTALADVDSRVAALDAGADDYISVPFELAELGARMRALLRRKPVSAGAESAHSLRFSGWRFEPARRLMYTPKGVRMTLTATETDLMLVFCNNAGRPLSRAHLIELIRGEVDVLEERRIDSLVSRLRRKLAQGGRQLEMVRTIRGGGYMFDPGDSNALTGPT
jgi:two-component system, OmpR family, response regulator